MGIKEHVDAIFGTSSSTLLHTDGIEVCLWPDRNRRDLGVACTIGMSDRVHLKRQGIGCPSKEPRVELLSYCHLADAPTFGQLLFDLSQYAFVQDQFLFWWHTIDLGRPLCEGSTIVGLMLSFSPYAAEEVTFYVGGKRRDLIWVVPLCAPELSFCRSRGVEAFEEILERADIDVADIYRASVV